MHRVCPNHWPLDIWEPDGSIEGMGLDGVELAIATEQQFGITLTNAEAERCRTPGQLVDLVLAKLAVADRAPCVHQRGFHLLRRALVQVAGLPRNAVRLDTSLGSLRTHRTTPEFWVSLRDAVGARSWPELVRPRWLVRLWVAASLGAGVVLGGWTDSWMLGGASVMGTAMVGQRATERFRVVIPPSASTPRGLLPHAMSSPAILWSRDQVAARVRELVIDILGLQEGQYREDADFVKDLGMD